MDETYVKVSDQRKCLYRALIGAATPSLPCSSLRDTTAKSLRQQHGADRTELRSIDNESSAGRGVCRRVPHGHRVTVVRLFSVGAGIDVARAASTGR